MGEIERFEILGELYYRRFHRLRPGKAEAMETHRSSTEPDNVRQFDSWVSSGTALHDAVDAILELSQGESEPLTKCGNLYAQLLPCPFCAGSAKVISQNFTGLNPPIRYGVMCDGDCGVWFDVRAQSETDAILEWNYRKPIGPTQTVDGDTPEIRVIDGCKHTMKRMAEWCNQGACPICLTAELGMLKDNIKEQHDA